MYSRLSLEKGSLYSFIFGVEVGIKTRKVPFFLAYNNTLYEKTVPICNGTNASMYLQMKIFQKR